MTTLTYGTLPAFADFEDRFDRILARDGRTKYRVQLSVSDSRAADGTPFGDGEYDARELYRALCELSIKNTHAALDLVSSVLTTLEFEWI